MIIKLDNKTFQDFWGHTIALCEKQTQKVTIFTDNLSSEQQTAGTGSVNQSWSWLTDECLLFSGISQSTLWGSKLPREPQNDLKYDKTSYKIS